MPVSDAAVDEERRLDFAVAVLARVQIEHEADERRVEPRAGAGSGPRTARPTSCVRAFEVDDAERGARGPSAACGSKSNAGGSP